MNLKTPLELPIYWIEGEEVTLQELGVKLTGEALTKAVTFYSIENISTGTIRDKECGIITSSGQEYGFAGTYEELKQIILDNLNQ